MWRFMVAGLLFGSVGAEIDETCAPELASLPEDAELSRFNCSRSLLSQWLSPDFALGQDYWILVTNLTRWSSATRVVNLSAHYCRGLPRPVPHPRAGRVCEPLRPGLPARAGGGGARERAAGEPRGRQGGARGVPRHRPRPRPLARRGARAALTRAFPTQSPLAERGKL